MEANSSCASHTTIHPNGKHAQFERGAIPRSHPVLPLNTRRMDDDGLFVPTFIHEQTHWWLKRHPRQTKAAMGELKTIYPTLPVGYPDGADTLERLGMQI